MDGIKTELKKYLDEYKQIQDLYNRLADIEDDVSAFIPKETDLETIRKCLIRCGISLQRIIDSDLKALEEDKDGNDN